MAGSIRQTREREMVRRQLEFVADSAGNAAPGQRSIDDIAYETGVDPESLRQFRDGNNGAVPQSFVTTYARLIGRGDSGFFGVDIDDILGFGDPSNGGWYAGMWAEEAQRQAKLRSFQLIDSTRPEASSALDAWADLGVTGNLGIDAHTQGGFNPIAHEDASQSLRDFLSKTEHQINDNVFPDDAKWQAFRGMVKYGSQFGEISLMDQGGRQVIEGIRPRHARTMMIHRDLGKANTYATPKNTVLYNPNKAYKQVLPGNSYNEPLCYFPEWKIVHFKNTVGWGDLYGRSIFDPCLRSWVQVESMEAGMIIRRLERASLRYKHVVDTGMIEGGDEQIKKYLDRYRMLHRKVRTVDGQKNYRYQKINMPVDHDIIIGKRDKNSPADVEVLEGDGSIGEITDFNHFFNKMLAGFGPPKAHLGYESDTMRSVITDLHIVFARKVRRMQLHFMDGLNHLYWLSMMLRGIDPRTARYTIFPPSMGTRDELMRAQVQLAHATTVNYLLKSFSLGGKIPKVEWVLRYIMGMDEEAIAALDMMDVVQPVNSQAGASGQKNDPALTNDPKEHARMVAVAQTNPEILETTDHLAFMLEERAIALRTPAARKWLIQRSHAKPFGTRFEEMVRLVGITELRDLRRAA